MADLRALTHDPLAHVPVECVIAAEGNNIVTFEHTFDLMVRPTHFDEGLNISATTATQSSLSTQYKLPFTLSAS